jgi:hypothetical protein
MEPKKRIPINFKRLQWEYQTKIYIKGWTIRIEKSFHQNSEEKSENSLMEISIFPKALFFNSVFTEK